MFWGLGKKLNKFDYPISYTIKFFKGLGEKLNKVMKQKRILRDIHEKMEKLTMN